MKNLAEIREIRGMSQSALARKTGLTATTIWRLEREYANARVDTALKLAKALDVSIAALIGERNDGAPQ